MARVLVTGSAGAIGQPVCEELVRRGHHVRGFDARPTPGVPESELGDLTDERAVRRAVSGTDVVVHLAATPDDAPIERLFGPNLLGVYHVLEAAREHGVARVVLASSVQTVGTLMKERLVTAGDRRPDNVYAVTKLWAEQLGEVYARRHGLNVIAARVAWMVRGAREAKLIRELAWEFAYLSRSDVARYFAASVEAEYSGFAVMYVVGPNGAGRFDLEPARRLLGWEPQDTFPIGVPDSD